MSTCARMVVGLLATVWIVGCGDDASPVTDKDAALKDAGPTSGDGGLADGAARDATIQRVAEVACGGQKCRVDGVLGTFAQPCCVDEVQATCGLLLPQASGGTGECNPLTDPDPRCDSVTVSGNFIIPSCCTLDGQCGLDATMFGMQGCTDLSELAMMLDGGMAMPGQPTLPEPRACSDSDSGSDDAGQ